MSQTTTTTATASSSTAAETATSSPPLQQYISVSDQAPALVSDRPGGIFIGPEHWVGGFDNDSNDEKKTFPSVSAVINESAHETGCSVAPDMAEALDAAWLQEAAAQFERGGALAEWRAYYDSSRNNGNDQTDNKTTAPVSNGRRLKLQIMVLPRNLYFKVHAHPNIEFEFTLFGALHEFRWPALRAHISPADNNHQPLTGPEIAAQSVFEHRVVTQGDTMVNQIGSTHQSFTDEGCAILVLWSGCHANTKPDQVHHTSPLLRPNAGWETE